VRGVYKIIFNAFVNLEPMQRSEDWYEKIKEL